MHDSNVTGQFEEMKSKMLMLKSRIEEEHQQEDEDKLKLAQQLQQEKQKQQQADKEHHTQVSIGLFNNFEQLDKLKHAEETIASLTAQNDELKSQSGLKDTMSAYIVAALDLVKQVAVQHQKKLEEKNHQLAQSLSESQAQH